MAKERMPGEMPEGEEEETPTPTPTPTPAPRTKVEPEPEDAEAVKAELDRTRAALKKANKEAAEKRVRLEELERQEEERKASTMGETERARKEAKEANAKIAEAERRAEDAERRLQKKTIAHEIERQATRMGFVYPDIVPSLIEEDRVEIDEDGKIVGVKEALERLAKDKPGLLEGEPRGGTPPRGGPTRKPGPGGNRPQQPDFHAELRETGNYQ